MQPTREMTRLLNSKLASIFGVLTEEKPMSNTERLQRKKYVGVLRWESDITAKRMSRFPAVYRGRRSQTRQRAQFPAPLCGGCPTG